MIPFVLVLDSTKALVIVALQFKQLLEMRLAIYLQKEEKTMA